MLRWCIFGTGCWRLNAFVNIWNIRFWTLFSSFSSIRTLDKDVLKFVLHALRPPRNPTREHINGEAFLLTCARDTQKIFSHEQNAVRLTRWAAAFIGLERLRNKTYEQAVSISTIQKTRKRKKNFPRAWRDQPIDRAGSHEHPSTPTSRPKRRVEPSGETKLPITPNLQDPFFRLMCCHPWQTGGISSSLFPKGTITAHQASNVPSGNWAPRASARRKI